MSDYGDMCKDLREMRREIAEQARLLGIGGTRESALMAKVDAITRERDEARAEVERLRSALGFYSQPVRYDGPNQRQIPGDPYTAADSAYMNDVCRDGGEIARAALAATETQP